MPRSSPGIRVRHGRRCALASGGRRCTCEPAYEASVPAGASGAKVRRTFPTDAAARAWRRDALAAAARGRRLVPADLTVRELADELLAGMRDGAIRNRSGEPYKPSVIASYDGALRRHVLPALGARRVGDVTRRDVQALVERLARGGADPSTIRNALMPLRVIYRRAVNAGDVDASAVAGVELPAVRGKRERYATAEEATRLIAAVPEHDRALWGLAFYAGLRSGEIAALRWRDVDLDAAEIHVRDAWCHKTKTAITTKSSAAVRVVPLPHVLRTLLAAHLELVDDPRAAALVVPSRAGRPFDPSTVLTLIEVCPMNSLRSSIGTPAAAIRLANVWRASWSVIRARPSARHAASARLSRSSGTAISIRRRGGTQLGRSTRSSTGRTRPRGSPRSRSANKSSFSE